MAPWTMAQTCFGPWFSLVVGDEGCIGPIRKLLCLCYTKKIMQCVHSISPYMFDCGADPVVHLLLLKRSMAKPFARAKNRLIPSSKFLFSKN